MNFTDLVELAVGKHKRPDKLVDTQHAINASVLYYSTEYDYNRDLVETSVPIIPASYTHTIDLTTLTRFRKVDYIRRAGTRMYLDELASRRLGSDCDVRNKWYIAGTSLRLNMAVAVSALDFSYFQYPPTLTNSAPEYWMLQGNWDAILHRALATIFNEIGDTQSATKALQDATLAAAIFRGDYVRSNQHS